MKKVLLAVLALGLGYLFFWPVPEEPVEWKVPAAVPLPADDRLKDQEWLHKDLVGPEAIAFDAQGAMVTGLKDGRVVRVDGDQVEEVGTKRGRVLGLKYGPDGRLYACDAPLGLIVWTGSAWETLASGYRFADDLDFAADGAIWFSDASGRHGIEEPIEDLLEHQTSGRLLRWDPKSKDVTQILSGLQFANGVAFGPDRTWLVLAETGNYRLTKVYLDGRTEPFATLPGFPDNITWSSTRNVFWVALGSPRNPMADGLAEWPFLRRAIFRLPKAAQPGPVRHTIALAYDVSGQLVENLQWKAEKAYAPAASAIEHDGFLYLGSYRESGYVRHKL